MDGFIIILIAGFFMYCGYMIRQFQELGRAEASMQNEPTHTAKKKSQKTQSHDSNNAKPKQATDKIE